MHNIFLVIFIVVIWSKRNRRCHFCQIYIFQIKCKLLASQDLLPKAKQQETSKWRLQSSQNLNLNTRSLIGEQEILDGPITFTNYLQACLWVWIRFDRIGFDLSELTGNDLKAGGRQKFVFAPRSRTGVLFSFTLLVKIT